MVKRYIKAPSTQEDCDPDALAPSTQEDCDPDALAGARCVLLRLARACALTSSYFASAQHREECGKEM
jgi:hypothetical protein